MLDTQERYPFVEWGILVSKTSGGDPRFPSQSWMNVLARHSSRDIKTSIHICGRWVRDICHGKWDGVLNELDEQIFQAERVQLNFHSYLHTIGDSFYESLATKSELFNFQTIFQLDGVNDHLMQQAKNRGIDAFPLYDISGGRGILPSSWPRQSLGVYTGYAGGLGPENIIEQIEKINDVATEDIWIDMETRVRSEDNSILRQDLVEDVLGQCSAFIGVAY